MPTATVPKTPSAAEILEQAEKAYEERRKAAAKTPPPAQQTLAAAEQGMTPAEQTARQAMLQKGGINNAFDAGGLKFTDAMSFGLLPKFHDWLQGMAGEERMGPKQADLLKAAQEEYPTGTGVGNIAGMAVPGLGGAKLASTAFRAGPVISGALGSGAGTIMDQSVRQETEGKPIDPTEAVASTAFGAGPGASLQALKLARKAAPTVGKAVLNTVLPPGTRTAATNLLNKVPQMPALPQGLLDTGLDAALFGGPSSSALLTGAERNREDEREARKRRRSRGGL